AVGCGCVPVSFDRPPHQVFGPSALIAQIRYPKSLIQETAFQTLLHATSATSAIPPPHSSTDPNIVVSRVSIKSPQDYPMREIKLQDLKTKTAAELVSFAEESGVENASTMRKQELMFAILKQLAIQET